MTDPSPPSFPLAWLAPPDVRDWLRLHDQDDADDAEVRRCCALAEAEVERSRPEFAGLDGAPYAPDAEAYQGAVMVAARYLRRRNSPSGVQVFGDAGVSFVSRYDADIDRALRRGAWAVPAAGG